MKEQPRGNHKWTDPEVEKVLADAPMDFNAAKWARDLSAKYESVKRIYTDALKIADGELERDPALREDPYVARIERAMLKLGWFKATTIFPYKNSKEAI